MILLEYEAKSLLNTFGVPTPNGIIIRKGEAVPNTRLASVVKSQVPMGGRGKLGGIQVGTTADELSETIRKLFDLSIGTHTPQTLLMEQKLDIEREFYLSLLIDSQSAGIMIVAHPSGGIEVEDNDQHEFLSIPYVAGEENRIGESLAELFDLPEQVFVLQDMVRNLGRCFVENDATLLEINPLILTTNGDLVAGDCKMTLDDAAIFRHPEWHFETPADNNNFVELNPMGDVATIANGAGLAMATVDMVAVAGYTPINFLDVGGGASEELILDSFTRLQSYPHLKAIIINIFAGITRCDDVARAIVAAKSQFPKLPPLYIRLTGTNFEEAKDILKDAAIELQESLDSCLTKLTAEVVHG